MAKRGRIPRLTEEVSKRFCEAIGNGLSIKRSAALIGVHPVSVHRWMAMGRKGEGGKIYANFVAEVAKSEARFIEENVKSVKLAATPRLVKTRKTTTRPDGTTTVEETVKKEHDWAAARWLLECKDRESFGPDRHEIAALKAEMKELQKVLTSALGRLGGPAAGEGVPANPENRAGAVEGGSGNPAAATPDPPVSPAGG